MVSVTPPERDRGQLILVGCLTLALTIIGIGLVINTTLYTQSASPALSNVQIDDASTFHLETRHGTRSLIHRINHGEWHRTEGALDTQLTGAVTNYSNLMAVSYAQSEPAAVNVSYNHANSQIGTRVIQRGPAGAFDASVENNIAADQRFGWFAMNVNVSRTSTQDTPPFIMTVSQTSGGSDSITWRIYRNTTGEATNLTVETILDNGSTFTRTSHCDPVRNRVLIDGYTGELVADQCWPADRPVFGIESVSPPHQITDIERQDKYGGKWEFVTNRSSGVNNIPHCTANPGPGTDEACWTPVVWSANVTATYDAPSATFVRDRNITIYGEDE